MHNSGIWSLVKRAPQATKKRMTFEVPGPAVEGAVSLDDRARQIFRYFKRYNYTVKETGEVITFEGIYAADKGQAAALVFYLFCGGCQLLCHGDQQGLVHMGSVHPYASVHVHWCTSRGYKRQGGGKGEHRSSQGPDPMRPPCPLLSRTCVPATTGTRP